MKNLRFECVDNKLHILGYPTADKVLELPDTHISKQLKDMILHQFDLNSSIDFMQSIPSNSDIVRIGLVNSAIVSYYKCFGSNKSRHNKLMKKKALFGLPKDAGDVFDYYKGIRDRFIAHDNSRYTQVYAGVIIESTKLKPFVDILATAFVADIARVDELQSFFNLISVTVEWVDKEIDKLMELLKNEYNSYSIQDFQHFNEIIYSTPSSNELNSNR